MLRLRILLSALFLTTCQISAETWSVDSDASIQSPDVSFNCLKRTVRGSDGSSATLQLVFFHTSDVRLKVIHYDRYQYSNLTEAFRANDCLVGVNGGFFDPELRPLGLEVSESGRTGRLSSAKLLSGMVQASSSQGIDLLRRHEFQDRDADITALIQTGPFLVDGNQAVAGLNDSSRDRRTFLATNYRGDWVLGVSSSVSLKTMGEILASPGSIPEFPVQRALNLDGGSSCALFVEGSINLTPWKRVRNLVGISLRPR